MKKLLEFAGGRLYLQNLRDEFLDQRAGAFRAFLAERVAAPVAVGVPAPPTPEQFAAARADLTAMQA